MERNWCTADQIRERLTDPRKAARIRALSGDLAVRALSKKREFVAPQEA